jgi:DNA-binding beta-propeller fold protein YncE
MRDKRMRRYYNSQNYRRSDDRNKYTIWRLDVKKNVISIAVVFFVVIGAIGCASGPPLKKTEVPSGVVWPEAPAQPRIKLVAAYKNSFDVAGPSTKLLRVIGEERIVFLKRPHGIVADRKGNLYVTDVGYMVLKLYEFNLEKNTFREIASQGPNRLKLPMGLALDNERGLLFVADSGGEKRVAVLDKNSGKIKFSIGRGAFERPVSVAVDTERQRVYVADTKLHVIKVFDYESRFLFSLGKGKRSDADDGFNIPAQVSLDRKGNLYVADMLNRYIKIFTPEGTFVKKIGYGAGSGFGQFSKLTGVAVNSEGHIYGLDTEFSNFQIFDQDNTLLLNVGEPGEGYRNMRLPINIFIAEDDRIYVTDTFNHRVLVFDYLHQ